MLSFTSWKLYDFRKHRSFANPQNLRRYDFLYQSYEIDYWCTPIVILARKILFVSVLVFVNNPAIQTGTLFVIINASLIFHALATPYVDKLMDVLLGFSLITLLFEALGGLMFYSKNLPDSDRHILEWII